MPGAGSELSTAAGVTYSGERFQKYFFDFAKNILYKICIPEASFPFKAPRNFGHGGVETFTLIAILISIRMSMET